VTLRRRTHLKSSALRRKKAKPKTARVKDAKLLKWRKAVRARAGNRCERCGAGPGGWRLEAHHTLLRSRGGKEDLWNGILLCAKCHGLVHDHADIDWYEYIASTPDEAKRIRKRLDARLVGNTSQEGEA